MKENTGEQKDKVYDIRLTAGEISLFEKALREYGGMLHSQEYPTGIESHNIEVTKKNERCFELQLALRKQCPDIFNPGPAESSE